MTLFTLKFWPGVALAVLLKVAPWIAILIIGFSGSDFYSGVLAGTGAIAALNAAFNLIKELRE